MKRYYSNGKLLLTAEYLVLDGAKSLAIPTKFGQDLTVESIKDSKLIWSSFTDKGDCWFKAIFTLPKLQLISATFISNKEGNAEFIAETLQYILKEAKRLNPNFLKNKNGFAVNTNLTFPQNWGLGSSSTLINNIAYWADVDAFKLLKNAFSGSGYDIACAKYDYPVFYQLKDKKPVVKKADFNPVFLDKLFFVYLNRKQNSREAIDKYKNNHSNIKSEVEYISKLSEVFCKSSSLNELNKIIIEHEQVISSIIKIKPIKKRLFNDYFGEIKSLGAWGGDFILSTGDENTPKYFQEKGYNTVLKYSEMIK